MENPAALPTKPGLLPNSPTIPIPKQIGPYPIESLLSKGGMSLLYLAKHPKTGETIVIKVVRPKYLKNPEILSRLAQEGKILKAASHPNIVKLFDLGKWEQGLFIAMEFVKGISLKQFIKQQALTHRRSLEITLQIAYALAHLHGHGIIHQDLKPDNILITESGEIKLIDFGISRYPEEEEDDAIPKKRKAGTPGYMSPEQKENPETVSYNADIFSLGMIAYELYLGKLCHGVIMLGAIPQPLRTIFTKALAIDPEERYADIIDFIADISGYLKKADAAEAKQTTILDEGQLAPLPKWPEIDLGTALSQTTGSKLFYLDFLNLGHHRFGIVLAEGCDEASSKPSALAHLRGLVQMALLQNQDLHPGALLELLNRALIEDPLPHTFHFYYLLLQPDQNALSFLSCGPGTLLHIPFDGAKPRLLKIPDSPFLGAVPNPPSLHVEENWTLGSTLILSSIEQDLEHAPENPLLSAQILAQEALNKLLTSPIHPSRGGIAISLRRL